MKYRQNQNSILALERTAKSRIRILSFCFLLSFIFQCEYKPKGDLNFLALVGSGLSTGTPSEGGIDSPSVANPPAVQGSGDWLNEAYFKPSFVIGDSFYGNSVAVSGDTIVVGEYRENSNQVGLTNGSAPASSDISLFASGAAFVYRKVAGIWIQEAFLKASNPSTNDNFGSSVSISGDTIVIGAPTNGASGSAYVFVRNGSTWSQEALLKSSNFGAGDHFGSSVDIDGDIIVVGAEWEDSSQNMVTNGNTASADNSRTDSGAAYIFRRVAGTWTQEAYLKTPNPDNNDSFGSNVSISGETVVVGAFKEDSQSVTSNGTTASPDNSKLESGAAYVFRRTAGQWNQEAFLKSSDLDSNDQFGKSVSISADSIVVGAALEDGAQDSVINGAGASSSNLLGGSGAAYVFERTGTNWAQTAYLKAKNVQAGDQFGTSVAIEGDFIVVGAINESSGLSTISFGPLTTWDERCFQSGAAYMFRKSSGLWGEYAYFKAPNVGSGDSFGYSVALNGTRVVVGATQEASNQTTITNGPTANTDDSMYRAGASYAFQR
ncbi:FG-GAP repeat protein [Leptospira stimsonii]|uniref:Integrin n=1 Tax=Leptospira stimsonii TaxID=2202203 RepID=A0A396ZH91_9LEPT|nr:FG-GAP repeat protein [Leptospira stimsonii]RHX92848.1 hypothetical protein DLM75_06695 [Leptospira stimsonii]